MYHTSVKFNMLHPCQSVHSLLSCTTKLHGNVMVSRANACDNKSSWE